MTVGVAAIQAYWFYLTNSESEYALEILITFFCFEIAILILTIIPGLKNKNTRNFLLGLTLIETVLFFLDAPIRPNELLMLLILLIRIYIVIGLFTKLAGQYYGIKNSGR